MRWLVIGGAVTLLGFTNPAAAQNSTIPPLEQLVDISYEIRLPAHECTVPSAFLGLVRRHQFLAGVEYLRVDCQKRWLGARRDGDTINLHGLSVGEALKKLTEIDPRYRLIERDGVVVMRPLDAWADPGNLLNFTTASFVLDDVNVGSALAAVVSALTGESREPLALDRSAQGTEQGARRFSVKTGAASVGEALSAIVRAHGDAWWHFGGPPGQPPGLTPAVSIYTFDGTGLSVSTRKRSPR
jgi:hypothetical protein